ncbi:ABC transporter permease [Pontiella sulfatireligans]|uniref:Inner membrane transport permease YbhR n=1 Tax=Pontiella sulfatireligans TaxID=2750658 RepID=A0A6C2UEM8_9BACT|nr:ABC transporter permease [Pontiella sulfatireligans]VGO18568.1 Inner membrane transport permease YbhR [Pontiella sulfatireligans]
MWNHLKALIVKELLAVLKDKKSRLVLIAPPLIQLMVFGYAATFDMNHIRYAVFNEDHGAASRELLAHFEHSDTFECVAQLDGDAQIAPVIDNKEALLLLRIPSDFSRNLALGQTANLQANVDGRNSNSAMLVLNYVQSMVSSFNTDWMQDHGESPLPAHLVVRSWYNPNLVSRWFIVPGIVGLLTLLVTLLITALSVAREREAGTFDQLLVTPLRPFEILLGKALPAVIIGLLEATASILIIVFWFKIPLLGSLLALYLGLFLFLLSSIGVRLMISSLAVTQQQGLLGAFLFFVPAIILSGFSTPIANMPEILQALTLLNPLRYFIVILRGVFLEGATVSLLWSQYWPMALIGLFCLFTAGTLFRRRMV